MLGGPHSLNLLIFLQPFNHGYTWENTTNNVYIADPSVSSFNTFLGTTMQQATSVVTQTNQNCYEGGTGCFSVYGFEYKPGFDNAVCPQTIASEFQLFLKWYSVYILGIRQQVSVDFVSDRHRTGSINRDLRPAYLTRTYGTFHSREAVRLY